MDNRSEQKAENLRYIPRLTRFRSKCWMWGMAIRFIWNNPARGMGIPWWLFMADLVQGAVRQCADISIQPNIAS